MELRNTRFRRNRSRLFDCRGSRSESGGKIFLRTALLLEHDMKTQMFDVKTLIIGLLLGVCTMLVVGAARGEAPQKLDADYRYQISAVQGENGGYNLFVLDHE